LFVGDKPEIGPILPMCQISLQRN